MLFLRPVLLLVLAFNFLPHSASNIWTGSDHSCSGYYTGLRSGHPYKVVEHVISRMGCVLECDLDQNCSAVVYNRLEKKCSYSRSSHLRIKSGSEFDELFFVREIYESVCYTYTTKDRRISRWDHEKCEKYPNRIYTNGNNNIFPGCDTCTCCQVKGCSENMKAGYNGTWSKSIGGIVCQRWDEEWPHVHKYNKNEMFPIDGEIYDAHNYCRNPISEDGTTEPEPWCYTTDHDTRWSYCGLMDCKSGPPECYSGKPSDYLGTVNVTEKGYTCQTWATDDPHKHIYYYDESFPKDGSVEAAHNYCRDPGDWGYLWCFTTDPKQRSDHCRINKCS